jgi:uncharacterized protein YjeT (DUF2065 family)
LEVGNLPHLGEIDTESQQSEGTQMAESIAVFASINFAIIGLSHLIQIKAWHEFFQYLHSIGNAGAFANGLITLLMGSLIVSFHNVWSGVPIILTLIGWCYIIKSTLIFLYPEWNLRSMKSVETASPAKLRIAGASLLVIALTMIVCVAMGQY